MSCGGFSLARERMRGRKCRNHPETYVSVFDSARHPWELANPLPVRATVGGRRRRRKGERKKKRDLPGIRNVPAKVFFLLLPSLLFFSAAASAASASVEDEGEEEA